ncbi:Permease of the drug/metabolite transporter (DMT) superfamily [Marinobacterium lacunae]|uniref:Permease of the drug/metabolite transporter (DMT) superfamily n=1 Tax=Marinobacterium lacunae TaxID=1232683 RepID=A0A081G1R9_9GAMM|nr:DMT family transporter [Marinobacterium lacunae]KEA64724.1 Permease of the drug/metabolite transporter (DMT) superfamily [Marinobacterium lacunae]MBR9882683.1 DMT family transporter [Oceanospirillales bacterium]
MSVKNQSRAMLLGGSAVLLWSTVATAFKLSLQWLSPVQLLGWASLFSTLVLIIAVCWQRQLGSVAIAFRERPLLCLSLGVINPAIYYLVLFRAYDLLPAQQAQAINYTWALTLSLLAVPLLKQPLRGRDMIALAGGYMGALMIATRGDLLALDFVSGEGVALAMISTLFWALYWILNARSTAPATVMLLICFLVGTPLVWALMAWKGDLGMPPLKALAGAAWVGLFEMGITFMLWLGAMRSAVHVSRVSNLIFLSPFLSLVFIRYLLDEPIAPATFIGLGMIIIAVIYQQKGEKAKPAPAEA